MKKKTFKKILSLLMVLTLFMTSTITTFADTDELEQSKKDQLNSFTGAITVESLNDVFSKYTLTGEGTGDEVTEINNNEDLQNFVDSINTGGHDYEGLLVNLNTDISWEGEWISIIKFKGTFKGNGHMISGLNNPFISYVDNTGIIDGVNISAVINKDGIVGGIANCSQGLIKNCTFSGSITSNDMQGSMTPCGGIAGINTGRIESCSTTSGTTICRYGMICGGVAGLSVVTENTIDKDLSGGIYECKNYANMICKNQEGGFLTGAIAGIVGVHQVLVAEDEIKTSKAQISSCENYGSIQSEGSASAGIVGIAEDTKIENCTNSGSVSQSNGLWTSGIVGSMNQKNLYIDIINTKDYLYVKNCVNTGDISGITRVSGIVGGDESFVSMNGTQCFIYVANCINTGNISTKGYAGGISGYCCGNITACINTGKIFCDLTEQGADADGWNAIGGIASRGISIEIADSVNIGEVRIDTAEPLVYTGVSGGIIGYSNNVKVKECYNSSPVTGNYVSSESDTKYTVYYGGLIGDGTVDDVQNSVFNNSFDDKAKRAVASYIGVDSNYGLDISEMTGAELHESMNALIENGSYKLSENKVIENITYQFTPVLTGMRTLYELDPETTLANAAYAIVDNTVPDENGESPEPANPNNPNGNANPTVTTPGTKTSPVATGDSSNMALWIVLMVAALAAICTVIFTKKKRNNSK